jgi:hypothetical protein
MLSAPLTNDFAEIVVALGERRRSPLSTAITTLSFIGA